MTKRIKHFFKQFQVNTFVASGSTTMVRLTGRPGADFLAEVGLPNLPNSLIADELIAMVEGLSYVDEEQSCYEPY